MKNSPECIILAGGKGIRMKPLSKELPKCLVKIANKEMLWHQIEHMIDCGISRVIISCNLSHFKKIKKFMDKHYKNNRFLEYDFSIEEKPCGTGGGIKKAFQKVKGKKAIIKNCDDLTNINYMTFYKKRPNIITIANPILPFGTVKTNGSKVAEFCEKPKLRNVWVSIGTYLLSKDCLDNMPDKFSIEYDFFPKLKDLKVYKHKGIWYTFNTEKDVEDYKK